MAGAVLGAGGVMFLRERPDPTPVLGSGSTLARVSTSQDNDAPDAVVKDSSVQTELAPGFDLGQILRRDGNGPWHRQTIDLDRVTTPYVADTAVCGSAEKVLVAAGNVSAHLSGIVLLDDVKAAVPTVWRSVDGRPWTKVPIAGAPAPSSLRPIVSKRVNGRSDRLVAVGQPLAEGQDPFTLVSDDCGETWQVHPLPVRGQGMDADAIWADNNGVLIAGSAAVNETATEEAGRVLAFWESKDGSSFVGVPARSDSIRLPGRVEELMRGGNVITLAAYRNDRDLTVLQLDGAQTGLAVVMDRVDDVQGVGLATTSVGLHFLSRREGGTRSSFTVSRSMALALTCFHGFPPCAFVSFGFSAMGPRRCISLARRTISLCKRGRSPCQIPLARPGNYRHEL